MCTIIKKQEKAVSCEERKKGKKERKKEETLMRINFQHY